MAEDVIHVSITLTQHERDFLDKVRNQGAYQDALTALLPAEAPDLTSDAELLHAVVRVGLRAIEDEVMEAGYKALADDPEVQAYHALGRASRSRRRPNSQATDPQLSSEETS